MFKTDRILVISPHADDEMFGCGGSLLRWKEQGVEIKLVLVAVGDVDFVSMDCFVTRETRIEEFRSSAEKLSTRPPTIFSFHRHNTNVESKLDTIPIYDIVYRIDNEIMNFKPDTILIPEKSHHQDHQVVNRACIASLRRSAKFKVKNALLYEEPGAGWGPPF